MRRLVDPRYWAARKELKELLNQPQPLAGGRVFQTHQDKKIQRLCQELSEYSLPIR